MVVSNTNTLLVTRVTELEKQQAKMEQYSRRNNVEMSGISDEVWDEYLEKNIDLNPDDIEACHRLTLGRVKTSNSKCVIVKLTENNQKLCLV